MTLNEKTNLTNVLLIEYVRSTNFMKINSKDEEHIKNELSQRIPILKTMYDSIFQEINNNF